MFTTRGNLRRHRQGYANVRWPMIVLLAAGGGSSPVYAAHVVSKASNVEVRFGRAYSTLEMDNPLAGNETIEDFRILEWRDAGFCNGTSTPDYEDFFVSHPCASCSASCCSCARGYDNEVWLQVPDRSAGTTTTVPAEIVSVHLHGDSNDGLAQILVDGQEMAVVDMGTSPGTDRAWIIVHDLAFDLHSITVHALGSGALGQDDVAIMGVAALETLCPLNGPQADLRPPDGGFGTKNRYASFVGGNPGFQTAVRVTFAELPPSHGIASGTQLWVGAPVPYCENSGLGRAPEPDNPPDYGCPPAPGQDSRVFWLSRLECEPFFTDWTQYPRIDVVDQNIVPDARYEFQEIDSVCDLADETTYSDVLSVNTSDRWCDIVLECATQPCSPPDGVVSVTDVLAELDKFANENRAPRKARCDLVPAEPDQIISIADIVEVLDAFSGKEYSFPPRDPQCVAGTVGAAGPSGPSDARLTPPAGTYALTTVDAFRGRRTATTVDLVLSVETRTLDSGGTVLADVVADGPIELRGYQVALEARGGSSGALRLVDLWVDTRRDDLVFGTADFVEAGDLSNGRVAAAALDGPVRSDAGAYLATFMFEVTTDAAGEFHLVAPAGAVELISDRSQIVTDREIVSDAIQVVSRSKARRRR